MEGSPGGAQTVGRLGPAAEALRSAVAHCPVRLGRGHRVSRILGGLLAHGRTGEVQARAGDGVLFPFLCEDLPHRAFWGFYEPGVRAVLRGTLRRGDVFVDLGAHRGFHSAHGLSLVGPDGLVIAVEPVPQNVAHLNRLAEINPGHRLVVVAAAVAGATGEVDLLVSNHSMLASIDHRPSRRSSVTGTLRVPALSLDDLCDRHVRGPAEGKSVLVKMDVEGAEGAVLLGGPRSLGEDGILRTMVLECGGGSRPRPRERAALIVRVLREKGFGIRVLEDRGGLRDWTEQDLDRRGVYLLAKR
jgi:FkbM family methyltransferase